MTLATLVLLGGLASAGDLEVGLDWTRSADFAYPRDIRVHRLRGRAGYRGERWGLELVGDLPLQEPGFYPTVSPLLPIEQDERPMVADRRRGEAVLTWTPARGTLVVADEVQFGVAAHLRAGAHLTEVGTYRFDYVMMGLPKTELDSRALTAGPLLGLGLEVLPVPWLALRLETSGHLRLEDGTRLEGVTSLGLGVRI